MIPRTRRFVVVHRRPDFVVARGNRAVVARWQQEEPAAVARVGPGQTDVDQVALPEVVQETDDGSGWHIDHDWTLGDIDVNDGVDRRVVGREPHRLGPDEFVGDA
jgi:hypothetical protein